MEEGYNMKLFGYTITIKKTPTRRTGFSSRRWTPSEITTLFKFKNENKSWSEIASLMDRTPAACQIKHHNIHKEK